MIVAISQRGMLMIAEQQDDGTWTVCGMPGNSIDPDKWFEIKNIKRECVLKELKTFGDDILHDDDAE